jgi:hypothetical protein
MFDRSPLLDVCRVAAHTKATNDSKKKSCEIRRFSLRKVILGVTDDGVDKVEDRVGRIVGRND